MKMHRPWQPHMGSSPLFNPYSPAGRSTTLDHFDLLEEPVDEMPMPVESAPPEEAGDPQAPTKRE
jgi:hypothetical protein